MRHRFDISTCKEFAKNLPEQMILQILNKCSRCPDEEIAYILQTENEKYTNLPVATRLPVSDDEIFTRPCPDMYCNQINCPYFHNPKQQRRPQPPYFYFNKPCNNIFRNNYWEFPNICLKKSQCKYAHTENELKYHRENRVSHESITRGESSYRIEEIQDPENEICCSETNYLKKNIEQIRNIYTEKQKVLNERKQQVAKVSYETSQLKSNNRCVICYINEYTCVNIPCGHPICYGCRSLHACSKCQEVCQIININN